MGAEVGAGVALAVDIGGTKLAVGLVGGDGVLVWRVAPTACDRKRGPVWSTLAHLIAEAPAEEATVCGVGAAGP